METYYPYAILGVGISFHTKEEVLAAIKYCESKKHDPFYSKEAERLKRRLAQDTHKG